ncbi:MAG: 3-deoxy-manno-octulosonate cytidylyltransferase [Planctomycetes bacterium]|nr:3-deoxy-manno-octulosonate cytidylyltransferase [Planctomycetota bacterium]
MAIIPARYASTRFPGKPLCAETGRPLIEHVYERVAVARSIGKVIVATDDERIAEAVRTFGGEVVMTRRDHPSGTDRVAEVAADLEADIIVNIQGDEPEIEPAFIDRLVDALRADADVAMATLACPFSAAAEADPSDPSTVKVVVDRRGRALYFSRSVIPYAKSGILDQDGRTTASRSAVSTGDRDVEPDSGSGSGDSQGAGLLHLGVYAYRRAFLLALSRLSPTPLERLEGLEQLRVLEYGYSIAVVVVSRATAGIDTPADYEAFVRRWNRDRGADS